jgi:hypothetical protein
LKGIGATDRLDVGGLRRAAELYAVLDEFLEAYMIYEGDM